MSYLNLDEFISDINIGEYNNFVEFYKNWIKHVKSSINPYNQITHISIYLNQNLSTRRFMQHSRLRPFLIKFQAQETKTTQG